MSRENPKLTTENNEESSLPHLSEAVGQGTDFEYVQNVKEDQTRQRKQMQENLQAIGNEKNKEYERQVREGFASASITKQENERFVEVFCQTEEYASGSLYDDKGKSHEYDLPWTSYPELDHTTELYNREQAEVGEAECTPDFTWGDLNDEPIYIEFTEPALPREKPSVHRKKKKERKCKIM